MVRNLPIIQETQVQSLGQKDPLEEAMSTHSSILAQRIPWTEAPGGLHSPWVHGVKDVNAFLLSYLSQREASSKKPFTKNV